MTDTTEAYLLAGEGIAIDDLPKVSLHDHLDGGLRPSTILDLAPRAGVTLPADEPTALAEWFRTTADSGSLTDYIATFEITVAVMQTAPALERVAREFVLDLAADGVVHGEVRWAPEQHQRAGLSLDAAVEAVQEGLEQGVQEAAAHGHHLRVGQIVTAMRHAERSLEIAELALRHRDRGALGFDIAGAEAGHPASRHRPAFEVLAAAHFPTTVHAGEADGLDSIRSALLDGRALRLGHGVRLAEDISIERQDDEASYVTLGALAEWVKDREIALELSPSSNLQTGAIVAWGTELADHPFDLLYQLGFRVTVNTDNRLMSATTLSRELALLADTFGYDLDDLEAFQLHAAQASFLPLDERRELIETISAGFEAA
ncbi:MULTISPECIES: adenosine deaminase [unclassified Rathayibacter]|uniref:adenosine deaminase n=1 Tax=unclassified Rathayibacter TaxID=2609250 RepID=UPI00188BF750|nr:MULTISPECIES: adenosine deaminase [unclassified Rathayibacter]MBF4461860.1 adenosine deaminase [Rathayibacter sp. VKM Ac-2879]MBF4503273.1 adenosine deaminase [Rathayibacter sp. VKM Ac-2878]